MKRRYSRVLAALAAATMGMAMETTCYIDEDPDDDNCLFCCDRSTEKAQTPPLTDTPLPLSQAPSGIRA